MPRPRVQINEMFRIQAAIAQKVGRAFTFNASMPRPNYPLSRPKAVIGEHFAEFLNDLSLQFVIIGN